MSPELIIGIDGGGTKTRVVVATPDCKVLGEGVSGPSNYLRVGMPTAVASVQFAVRKALEAAGVTLADVRAVFAGLAGLRSPTHRDEMLHALRPILPDVEIMVNTDAAVALAGATDGKAGVVIISGTGAVAFGINKEGRTWQAGGWGWVLGDEGSGYFIARRGLAAIVRAYDGRGRFTLMTEKLCSSFGVCDPRELPGLVYHPEVTTTDIAKYARFVTAAAKEGDEVAIDILREAGIELGQAAVAVIRKLEMLEEEFRVAYVGGVFRAGELLIGPLRNMLGVVAPRAELGAPLFTPAVGAVKLALQESTRLAMARDD
ncbi:MAG TPA: BadF/BadG/BcrA/BcrD ATPase family protein [Blastocatellia bacterium]|nr:BadF/BadG/BcrA/BcrD ATPase family protein [Blastocatellia bacterium]